MVRDSAKQYAQSNRPAGETGLPRRSTDPIFFAKWARWAPWCHHRWLRMPGVDYVCYGLIARD